MAELRPSTQRSFLIGIWNGGQTIGTASVASIAAGGVNGARNGRLENGLEVLRSMGNEKGRGMSPPACVFFGLVG